jgi:hypothetical protein
MSSTPPSNSPRPRLGRRLAAAAVVLATAVLALAPVAWAMRPVGTPDAGRHRLLPAVAFPAGPERQVHASRLDRPVRPASPRRHGSGLVWDTSRGYPVAVEPSPAGQAPSAPAPYSWLLQADRPGRPAARWSPCAPLDVRINPAGFTPAARAEVRRRLAELEERTGLRVRVGEETTETVTGPLSSRPWTLGTWTVASQRRWAPVLVLASDEKRTPELAGAVGGWTHVHTDGGHLVSGVVALDVDDLPEPGRDATARLRLLVRHELGHLAGLGHVADQDLVMHAHAVPEPGETTDYRYGDRLGLAVAGRGRC